MTKEEFIKQAVTIAKYKGDLALFLRETLNKVDYEFSLNDSFYGTVNDTDIPFGDIGEHVRIQFHDLCRLEHKVPSRLPLVNCKIVKNFEYDK